MSKHDPTLLSAGQDLKALTGILNAVFTEKAKAAIGGQRGSHSAINPALQWPLHKIADVANKTDYFVSRAATEFSGCCVITPAGSMQRWHSAEDVATGALVVKTLC